MDLDVREQARTTTSTRRVEISGYVHPWAFTYESMGIRGSSLPQHPSTARETHPATILLEDAANLLRVGRDEQAGRSPQQQEQRENGYQEAHRAHLAWPERVGPHSVDVRRAPTRRVTVVVPALQQHVNARRNGAGPRYDVAKWQRGECVLRVRRSERRSPAGRQPQFVLSRTPRPSAGGQDVGSSGRKGEYRLGVVAGGTRQDTFAGRDASRRGRRRVYWCWRKPRSSCGSR